MAKLFKVVTYSNYPSFKEFGHFSDFGLNRFQEEEKEIVTPVVTVTPEKFLICLLYCNSYATVDLKTAIKALNYKSEKALARYEESLDSNLEIIHENLYEYG